MRFNLKASFLAAFAIFGGVVVLAGYFFQLPGLVELRNLFLRWAVILSAVLLLVGVLNLARAHWRKITTQQPGGFYSIILLISLFLTLAALVVERFGLLGGVSSWLLNYITVPIESSLMAVVAIVLVYAGARLFSRRLNLFSIIFIGVALFIMIGTAALPGFDIPGLRFTRDWLVQVWAAAGARGMLLGIGLGTIATGLRILMGSDRPYGG